MSGCLYCGGISFIVMAWQISSDCMFCCDDCAQETLWLLRLSLTCVVEAKEWGWTLDVYLSLLLFFLFQLYVLFFLLLLLQLRLFVVSMLYILVHLFSSFKSRPAYSGPASTCRVPLVFSVVSFLSCWIMFAGMAACFTVEPLQPADGQDWHSTTLICKCSFWGILNCVTFTNGSLE